MVLLQGTFSPLNRFPDAVVSQALAEFFACGVSQVSPGALGMHLVGKPFTDSDVQGFVTRADGVEWDGVYMIPKQVSG